MAEADKVEVPVTPEVSDPGLGLSDFLGKSTPEAQASPAAEPKEAKPEKVDDKPAAQVDKEVAKPGKEPALKADDKKADASAAQQPQPDAKPNWDDDENPWKKKAGEFDQRYRDTHKWGNQLNQALLETQRQMQVLQKKFDGTYDPQVDEPAPPDPVAIRQWGEITGKAEASLEACYEAYGQDNVVAKLNRYREVFGQDLDTQQRILRSNHPVKAALDAVDAYDFTVKYGPNPSAIVQKMRAEIEAELTPKITERITKELAKSKSEPKGIGGIQGGSGAEDKAVSRSNAGRQKSLGQLFGS